MNSTRYLLKGYLLLGICLFIFAMWALNLFYLAEREVKEELLEGPKTVNQQQVTYKEILIPPRPFLYFFAKKLGFDARLISQHPTDQNGLLVIVNPALRPEPRKYREILNWVKAGGSLAIFLKGPHAIASSFGVEMQPDSQAFHQYGQWTIPLFKDANRLSGVQTPMVHRPGVAGYRPYLDEEYSGSIFCMGRGQGQIILVSNPDLQDGDGLKQADNGMFVCRLFEYLSHLKRVWFLDTSSGVWMKARIAIPVITKKQVSFIPRNKKYLSFWSLIKANPISWVLAQMLTALFIFAISQMRQFGRPIPTPKHAPQFSETISGLGRLLAKHGDHTFIAKELLREFLRSICVRLSLPTTTPVPEVQQALANTRPKLAEKLTEAFQLANTPHSRIAHIKRLLALASTLESARKELNIHD